MGGGVVVLNRVGFVGLATILVKAPSSDPGRTLLIRMWLTGLGDVVSGLRDLAVVVMV